MTFTAAELDSPELGHTDPYLDWHPAEHREGCKEKGWQVRTFESFAEREPRPVGMRAYCPTCGVEYELTANTSFRDQAGDAYGPTVAWNPFPYAGHGTKPKKVLGYWMHAWGKRTDRFGAPGAAKDLYERYHLTASATPPSEPAEVLGGISWALSQRSRIRWQACLVDSHITAHGRVWLTATETAPTTHTSPVGAARWIVGALSDSSSS